MSLRLAPAILIIFTFFLSLESQARPNCLSAIVKSVASHKRNSLPSKLEKQLIKSKDFNLTETREINDVIDSLYFIDYYHQMNLIYQARYAENTLGQLDIPFLYDASTEKTSAFKNYKRALKFLREEKPKFNWEGLTETHRALMRGRIEELPAGALGKARNYTNLGSETDLTDAQIKTLKDNPYLTLVEETKTWDIYYPSVDYSDDSVFELIKSGHPDLYKRIHDYRNGNGGSVKSLTVELTTAMTEDLMAWFVREKDQIGAIKTVADLRKFVKIVAKFQRDLISIHPFGDGNGRTVRMFALYMPFMQAGIPRPRITNPNNDYIVPLKEWEEQILEGIQSSYQLYNDLFDRIQDGRSLRFSPYLYLPQIPEYAQVAVKGKRGAKPVRKAINPQQVATYFDYLGNHPGYSDWHYTFEAAPFKALDELEQMYLEFTKRTQGVYHHKKRGKLDISVNLLGPDFRADFFNAKYLDPESYKAKMDKWYMNQTVWRGLPYQEEEVTEKEILELFTGFSNNFIAMNIGYATTQKQFVKKINKEFDRFNEMLVSGEYIDYVRGHVNGTEKYDYSFGYSTSRERSSAKGYAMGLLVIGDYKTYRKRQDQLKSRVLMGVQRCHKDIDVSILRQVDDRFRYKYPRQREVLGIGAADPDSMRIVQTLDDDGEVIFSYLRNPEKPYEVLKIKGQHDPDSKRLPAKSRILEVFDLRK
ncbi:MAG: Fic family protein [Bacteriovoracaceae bacterium]